MIRILIFFLIGLAFLFPGSGAASDDPSGQAVTAGADRAADTGAGPDPAEPTVAARQGAVREDTVGGPFAEKVAAVKEGQDAYEVDLGKVWNVSPDYFRKVFDGAGDTEPSGLKAKIEENLYGTIETKWGPANLIFGSMARFFASSPVLADREYNVRRTMLYE